MKSLKTLFFVLWISVMVGATYAFADEESYCSEIEPAQYNDVWEKQFKSAFRINYDTEDEKFIFYSKEPIAMFGFVINRTQADKLIDIIDKYKEWNLKASEKNITLQKEISTFTTTGTFWEMGDSWSFAPKITISALFFSQSEQFHQMVLRFPKVASRSNQYDTHKGEELYFDWDNALKLKECLKQENVEKFLSELKKKKDIEAEFQ